MANQRLRSHVHIFVVRVSILTCIVPRGNRTVSSEFFHAVEEKNLSDVPSLEAPPTSEEFKDKVPDIIAPNMALIKKDLKENDQNSESIPVLKETPNSTKLSKPNATDLEPITEEKNKVDIELKNVVNSTKIKTDPVDSQTLLNEFKQVVKGRRQKICQKEEVLSRVEIENSSTDTTKQSHPEASDQAEKNEEVIGSALNTPKVDTDEVSADTKQQPDDPEPLTEEKSEPSITQNPEETVSVVSYSCFNDLLAVVVLFSEYLGLCKVIWSIFG